MGKKLLSYGPSTSLFALFAGALATLSAGNLASVGAWFALMMVIPVLGALWMLTVLVSALIVRRWGLWRWVGLGVGLVTLWPTLWLVQVGQFVFPLPYDAEKELAITVPMDGEVIVGWGGDSVDTNYHSAYPDQRWAYDLVVDPVATGSDKLEDYGCYGVPVYAPVSGTVARADTGLDDAPPGALSGNVSNPLGNVVWIHPAKGGYLALAHLKKGSVRVKTGDRITEGDLIGECGNSGNTWEPHIHMHYQAQDPNEYPHQVAVGLPLRFRGHEGPARPVGGYVMEDGAFRLLGDRIRHVGTRAPK